ncbi:MAG: hypothetical protein IPP96_11605 [Chitinophagaceae bacterium]|nr:hypothetical protein [Chitinophagaceae bacterium]
MAIKTNIFRLGSLVPHGVGDNPDSQMIDLIYSILLQEFGQDIYSHIRVQQIGNDLDELIIKEKNNVHINIRYPAFKDFETKSEKERNSIRVDIIHKALVRLAEKFKKLDISKLELIKDKILANEFAFNFLYKTYVNPKRSDLVAKLFIQPLVDRFNFSLLIEEANKEKCKILLYSGIPSSYYIQSFFLNGKWRGQNEFLFKPKREFEIKAIVDKCLCEVINLTEYEKPPLFEMMKADISKIDIDKAHADWVHSMPPAIAAIVTHNPN